MAIVISELSAQQRAIYVDAKGRVERNALTSKDHSCYMKKNGDNHVYREISNNDFLNLDKPYSVLKGALISGGLTATISYLFTSTLNPLTAFVFSSANRFLDCCNHKFFGDKVLTIEGEDIDSYEIRTNQTPNIYSKLSIAALVGAIATPILGLKLAAMYSALSFVCNSLFFITSRTDSHNHMVQE